jgi:hypothetical protein
MFATHDEKRLQAAAMRHGLKLGLDRYSTAATGTKRYFIRAIWDAKRVLRALPSGQYGFVKVGNGKRIAGSLLLLNEVESILATWNGPRVNPPGRLPWRGGVIAANIQAGNASQPPSFER